MTEACTRCGGRDLVSDVLKDGERQLKDGERQLKDGERQLKDGKRQLKHA